MMITTIPVIRDPAAVHPMAIAPAMAALPPPTVVPPNRLDALIAVVRWLRMIGVGMMCHPAVPPVPVVPGLVVRDLKVPDRVRPALKVRDLVAPPAVVLVIPWPARAIALGPAVAH